jgi:putative SOS response-associated peptidase YedK
VCGRYTLATPAEELVETFGVGELSYDWFAGYNISPGQDAPVVAEDRRGRRIGLLRWGLAPAWMDEPGTGFVNARAESVVNKPSFREAYRRRRCLVPADGFYEWSRPSPATDGVKQPFWFHPRGGGLVSFAGLWETWQRPDLDARYTFTILTTEANADVRSVHDRMPLVIAPDERDTWLARTSSPERLAALLNPAPDGTFDTHPVSTRVNRTTENDRELIAPVEQWPVA